MNPPSSALTIIIVSCLTAGAAALLLLVPISIRYQTAVANQAQWTADSDRRSQQELASSHQSAALANVRPQVLELLPESNNQYDLVVQIEGLSRSLGLPLTSLSVTVSPTAAAGAPKASTASTSTGPSSVALSVGATGTYAQVLSFVQALPTINRSLLISQVIITSALVAKNSSAVVGAGSPTGQIAVTITASAAYQDKIPNKAS